MRHVVPSGSAACIGAAALIIAQIHSASATDFTAGVLMEKMPAESRVYYIEGVIEGLAYARYSRDNEHFEGDQKTTTGMKCIYDWFYQKPNTMDLIYAAFGRFPTYTPAAIIGNLVKQECPA